MSDVRYKSDIFVVGTSPGSTNSLTQIDSDTEMCSGSEADSHLRLIDSCITQLKAQGPSRTCNESKEEEEEATEEEHLHLQEEGVVRCPANMWHIHDRQAQILALAFR